MTTILLLSADFLSVCEVRLMSVLLNISRQYILRRWCSFLVDTWTVCVVHIKNLLLLSCKSSLNTWRSWVHDGEAHGAWDENVVAVSVVW